MTERIYDTDSHCSSFTAVVTACEPVKKGYLITLDRTAFFPEGGGQAPDEGTLNGIPVLDVQEGPERSVTHLLKEPLEPGTVVSGQLDWPLRFARMQSHSGEHIVSGTMHSLYGCENVGFHMGADGMILDFDKELSEEQIRRAEELANRAVWANVPISVEYPAPEVLAALDYRSKLDLTENVRIVTIPGVDVCACCAPHVAYTGEVGVICVLEHMRHRGGTRLRVLSGEAAFAELRMRKENISSITALLSAKPEETAVAVARVNGQLVEEKKARAALQRELVRCKLDAMEHVEGNRVLFEENLDRPGLQDLVTGAMEKTGGICAAFSGSEKEGFRYIIGSKTHNLREEAKAINAGINGRGGGSPQMMQGSAQCTRQEIRKYFLG